VIGPSSLGSTVEADELREQIRYVRSRTDKPALRIQLPEEDVAAVRRIALELQIDLIEAPRENEDMGSWVEEGKSWAGSQVEVLLEEEVPVFASGLGTPGPFADALRANGTTILSLVGTVRAAAQVVADGADYVVAQGTEAGGHTGRIGTLALLPQIMKSVTPTPVIAAGGIAGGAALAGVLATGGPGRAILPRSELDCHVRTTANYCSDK
jgi:NAD(P)H-dependent flavin oxidoreductase YrpB (nitropropane dioxygenase family)